MPTSFLMLRRLFSRPAMCVVLPLLAACGPSIKTATKTAPAPPGTPSAARPTAVVAPAPLPAEDPVLSLLAESNRHFKAGQAALEAGHVDAARLEFDRSMAVLIESSYGGRTEPRIREQFDRLVDRISTYEVKALAQGDGFTEKPSEPATLDELLAASVTLAPATPAEVTQAVVDGLQNASYDVPIPLNARVLAFVGLFQGRLRGFLEDGLRRGAQYLPMIQSVFRAEGLPLDLAYVPLVESAFKSTALSRAKARGMWQFMRGTGLQHGLRQDWYIDERSDPEKATVAASKFLRNLGDMFDGDWHLALASYNGGPGRVQRALKRGNADDFWTLAARPQLLPRETRDYVPMILAAIIIAKNPSLYGFEIAPTPPVEYETVEISRPVDLRRVAEWTDSTISDIQSLNPELRRWTTPVRNETYALRVPLGAGVLVRSHLEETPAVELASLNYYIVKKGETLSVIARKLRVSRADLAEANFLKPTSPIAAGRKLMVPREPGGMMAAKSDRPVPAVDSRTLASRSAVTAPPSGRVKVNYQVKKGESLASIARLFGTSIASLRNWNRLPGSTIHPGDRLTIYTARSN